MQVIKAPTANVHHDMPAAQYHSDADGPRLSSSLAKLIVQKSELHAYAAHPLMGLAPYSYEGSEHDGTLIHLLVLEPDTDEIIEIDPTTIRTKDGKVSKEPMRTDEGKALRSEIIASGRVPVLTDKLNAYKYKAKAIRQRFADHPARQIEFTGDSEVVIYWTEQSAYGPVECRCRIDHLRKDAGHLVITDLKSSESAASEDIRSHCWRYGYDIQQAAYTRAVEAAFPDMAGRVVFEFGFLELEKPYAVNPVTLSGKFARMGERRWLRAVERWATALQSDTWLGYNGGVIEPPAWAEAYEMGGEE